MQFVDGQDWKWGENQGIAKTGYVSPKDSQETDWGHK